MNRPTRAVARGASARSAHDDHRAAMPRNAIGASTDIAVLARRQTKAALEAFVAVMQDGSAPAAARVAAATQILNWGHGKSAAGEGETAPKTVKLAWEA